MLIGIDAHHANKPVKTGTEWYAFDLLRWLPRVDDADTLRLYTPSALDPALRAAGKNVESAVLRWPPPRLWTQLRLSLEMLVRQPDILFVPAHAIPIIHPRRTVTTVHDVGFLRSPELYSALELAYNKATTAFGLRVATRVIVPSAFTKSEILHFYPNVEADTIIVIHHGFERERFTAAIDDAAITAIKNRLGIQRPYLLFLGRIQQKKNIPRLVRAFALARRKFGLDRNLVLGGKPDFGFDEVQRLIRDHGLEHHVHLPGYLKEHDRVALLHGAEAFVFPSLYEGFGFPILEAQASGIPVLASTATCLPEIAGDGALLVDPLSDEAIAAGMNTILTDTTLRKRLVEAGFANLERFQWNACARTTLSVLTGRQQVANAA